MCWPDNAGAVAGLRGGVHVLCCGAEPRARYVAAWAWWLVGVSAQCRMFPCMFPPPLSYGAILVALACDPVALCSTAEQAVLRSSTAAHNGAVLSCVT